MNWTLKRKHKLGRLFTVLTPAAFGFVELAAAADYSAEYHTRYITEGRDNLDNQGIAWVNIDVPINATWSLFSEYGYSKLPQARYTEWIKGASFSAIHDEYEFQISFSHIEFKESDEQDRELLISVSKALNSQFTLAYETTYSFLQNGRFDTVKLSYQPTGFIGESTSLYSAIGFDFGYASAEFDGYNHVEFGIDNTWTINETTTLSTLLQFAIQGTDIRKQIGKTDHQVWLNVNLTFSQ